MRAATSIHATTAQILLTNNKDLYKTRRPLSTGIISATKILRSSPGSNPRPPVYQAEHYQLGHGD